MDIYSLLILFHLVLFAYWLGGDLGVFHSAGYLIKPELSGDIRAVVLKILGFVDMAPRYCLILMLPSGFSLGVYGGWIAMPGWALAPIWLFAFGWLALVTIQHVKHGKAPTITRVDYVIRYSLIAILIGLAVWSFMGGGLVDGGWLALKILIFALTIICGLCIRLGFKPFGPAFASIMQNGSTPEAEADLKKALNTVRPFVIAIWVGILINGYLGIAKPF